MADNFNLTIGDILRTPHFKEAKLLAGAGGLDRVVKWVHILEGREFVSESVNGMELILTTGVDFTGKEIALTFLEKLINKNVSGLGIELVSYITELPDEMIRLADKNNFPLIGFPNFIRYIDITRFLHTIIISKTKDMFPYIEDFMDKISTVLLSPHNLRDILLFSHTYLGVNVAYFPEQGDPQFVPQISSPEMSNANKLFDRLKNNLTRNVDAFKKQPNFAQLITKPVCAFNNKWGELCFFSFERELSELEDRILGKLSHMVAQEIMRELYVKEKGHHEENAWLMEWLKGKLPEKEVYKNIRRIDAQSKISGYTVCLFEFSSIEDTKFLKELILTVSMVARLAFEHYGFYFLNSIGDNQLTCILFDKNSHRNWKNRAKQAIERIKESIGSFSNISQLIISIGKMIYQPSELNESLVTAQEAVAIQKRFRIEEPIYEMLHIYRVVSRLDQALNLNDYISDYLGPMIEYDNKQHGELIKTLKTFYSFNCSSKKTADYLHITRQTLFFRLQKIKDIIGEDFTNREKRLAIELAICAYEYITG
ncbi:MAG: PucR family transcriptional regulator ligand-binding domain-containing protein [Dehalobacterium sp.]